MNNGIIEESDNRFGARVGKEERGRGREREGAQTQAQEERERERECEESGTGGEAEATITEQLRNITSHQRNAYNRDTLLWKNRRIDIYIDANRIY